MKSPLAILLTGCVAWNALLPLSLAEASVLPLTTLASVGQTGSGDGNRFVPFGRSEPQAPPTDPFMARQQNVVGELTNDSLAKARQYLSRGRSELAAGNLTAAVAWQQKAAALNAQFSPTEYSPQQLAREIQQAGGTVAAPENVGRNSAFPSTPPEDNRLGRLPPLAANPGQQMEQSSFAERAVTRPGEVQPPRSPLAGNTGPAAIPSFPASSQPLPSADSAKAETLRLMALAQAALDRGDLETAQRWAQQAERAGVPDEAFRGNEPRPWMLLMEIDRRLKRNQGVVPAGGFSQPQQAGRYPVSPGVYNPQGDVSRNVPASSSSALDGEEGARLFESGMEALRDQQIDKALGLFREAWKFEEQLDPAMRQELKDKLSSLQARGVAPPRAAPDPLNEAENQQNVLRQQLFREIASERSAAERMLQDDPRGAVARLKSLRDRVASAELGANERKHMLTLVDRAVNDMERYVQQNLAQIELDEANTRARDGVESDRRRRLEVQNKLAELVEQFNTLIDEQRYPEAEVIAKQAFELAPEEPVVQNLLWQSRFVRRVAEQMALKDRKEQAVYDTLLSVEEAGTPFDDRYPIQWGDVRSWNELTLSRKKMLQGQGRTLSPGELQIREALSQKVDVSFTERPLSEVINTLGQAAGVNVYLDPQGLHAEGVTSDTPVTINLTQPISLKSALNLILEPLRLSYVNQNEVLRITSEAAREEDVVSVVYHVADLVIPIPNFVPSYNMGLPGAIRESYNALGYGGAVSPAGMGPLTVANNNASSKQINPVALGMQGAGGYSPGGPGSQPGPGPGGLGGGVQADFDTLIDLITTTIAPQTWDTVGGPGSVAGFDTNLSLVVSQTQEVHEQISDLLEQLRRLQDLQVTIEVRFITLNDNFFERIGIDFDFSIDDNVSTPVQVGSDNGPSQVVGVTRDATGANTIGGPLDFTQDGFGAALPAFGGFDVGTAANFGFAILSDIEMFFVLQAAQGDQRTNVLQAPKVTLFNGQQAFVSDTSQRPFVTSVVPVVGDFAAAQQPVIVVLSEGTSLSVQAVVSNDRRFVRLTLVPFFSKIGDVQEFTFTGRTTTDSGTNVADPTGNNNNTVDNVTQTTEGTTIQLPTFQFTTVTTTVSVPDGGTVLLGGVKRLSEGRNERGVPMLNKLPYINRLFSNVGIGRSTQSLMMMVTPRIIIQEEEEEKTVGRPLN